MNGARIIRKFCLTDTLLAMQRGQWIELPGRLVQPEVVRTTARRLKKSGRGEYEVHRCEGDSQVIRLR